MLASVLCLLTLGVPALAAAQTRSGLFRHLGFEAGVGRSTLSGPGPSSLTNLMAGFYVTPSPDTFTWQVEGLVHWQGARIEGANLRMLDVELPVLLRVNLTPAANMSWYLVAGPAVAYRAKVTLETGSGPADLTEFSPTLAYSVVGGVGVSGRRVGVAVRLHRGLNGTNFLFGGRESRTRSVTALITFRIE